MAEHELHGFYTAEIFRIHDMLSSRHVVNFGIQMHSQLGHDWVQDGNARYLKFPAAFFKLISGVFVDNGIKNETWVFADTG